MSITYNWSFPQFDVAPSLDNLNDVVVTVHWRLSGTDEDNVTSEVYGTVNLGVPNPDDFTTFDSITKEQTIEWVSGAMDVPALKQNIANSIALMKNPPQISMQPPFE